MYLTTGDIITATIDSLPFFLHKGIIVIENGQIFVFHNTPTAKNVSGGNVVKEDFNHWIESRQIIDIERTDMTKDYIETKSNELSGRHFNIFTFNCEQYVSLLKNGWVESPQLLFCIGTILLLKGM